jgi:hypothetical protein
MLEIIAKVMREGKKEYSDGENYQNNAVQAWRHGNTISVEDVCRNEYGCIFNCGGYSYEFDFPQSELDGIPEGYLGCFLDDEF